MAKTVIHQNELPKIEAIAARENVGAKHITEFINELLGDFLGQYRYSFGGKSIQTVCPELADESEQIADDLDISNESAKQLIDLTVYGDGDCNCGGSFVDGDCDCCGKYQD